MKWAMIYYWWNDGPDVEAWRDITNPIIPAIAMFRANNATMPIYVLDASNRPHNWGYYPFKLKFSVVRVQPHVRFDEQYEVTHSQCKLLSRMTDVYSFARTRIGADAILFCDTDVFWVKDFFPILPIKDGFYANKLNNGVYYYTHNHDSSEAFRLIQEHTAKALVDKKHREAIVNEYYASFFNDEAVYIYVRNRHQEIFKSIALYDNYAGTKPVDHVLENAKNYHLTQSNFGQRRGIFALAIKEFYDKLKVLLTDTEIVQIFGEKNVYLAKTFSLSQLNKARLILNSNIRIHA